MDNNNWQDLGYSPVQNVTFGINGWIDVKKIDVRTGKEQVVFAGANTIVDEGKGALMDLLASDSATTGYSVAEENGAATNAVFGPFDAIVCTKTTANAQPGDTWKNSVWEDPASTVQHYISYDGVLHAASATLANQCTIQHTAGSLAITLAATMPAEMGNKGAASLDNRIRSVVVAMNVVPSTGYNDIAYGANTGNERVFARVRVGDLIKTNQNAFQFTWTFTMTSG